MDAVVFTTLLFASIAYLYLANLYQERPLIGIAGFFLIVLGAYTLNSGVTISLAVNSTVKTIDALGGPSQPFSIALILIGSMYMIMAGVRGEK
ncbi:hypothetical protein [Pyrococcus kukulkanii]|uniref:hypothetical protein n=1 Tax=Pyrococcus kukulkanii TaxID=1609559 RepID=UPI00356472E8